MYMVFDFFSIAVSSALREHPLSWLFADIHDGVHMGSTERARADEFSGAVPVHSAVSAVGALLVLDSTWKQRD